MKMSNEALLLPGQHGFFFIICEKNAGRLIAGPAV